MGYLLPVMVMSSLINWTWPLWKTAVKLLLHNWLIESRALFLSNGKTWAWQASISSCGKGNIAVCMDCIVSPLGSIMEMPCLVGTLLVQG